MKNFHNFKRKCDIFKNLVEYQKITSTERFVTFDVGWLYPCLIRFWKFQNVYFSKNYFWVPFGVPRLTVKSHLYASSIYLLFKIKMNSVLLSIVWLPLWYPKNCVANFEIKASKFYISHVIIKCWQDFTKSDAFAWFHRID